MKNIIKSMTDELRKDGLASNEVIIIQILQAIKESPSADIFEKQIINFLKLNKNSICKLYGSKEYIDKLSYDEKLQLVQLILVTFESNTGLGTPPRLYKQIISSKIGSKDKVLIPEMKNGGTYIELLRRGLKPENICVFCRNARAVEFVKFACKFIDNCECSINENDFLSAELTYQKFDYVICNPPFGLKVLWTKDAENKKWVPAEFLYLENIRKCIDVNSEVVILFPNGILENAVYTNLRKQLKEDFDITEVISLYSGAFKPFTNIKTCILRLRPFTGVSGKMVKLAVISDEKNLETSHFDTFNIPLEDLSINNFTPDFYQRLEAEEIHIMDKAQTVKLGDICSLKKERAKILKDSAKNIDYIDISSVDAKTGIINSKEIVVSDAPRRAYYEVEEGNLIIAVSGGGIGTKSHVMAVIDREHNHSICSNGFRVLSLKEGINPYYLWYFMRSDFFLKQVELFAGGSVILNLRETDLLSLKVIIPDMDVQNRIAEQVVTNIRKLVDIESFLCKNESTIKNIMKGKI